MDRNKIYQRINHYIKYLRKKLLNKDHLGQFKQFEFVKISPNDTEYEVLNLKQICSVKILSKIERNLIIAEVYIYDFLLKKFKLSYIYNKNNIETQDYLCQCVVDLFFRNCKNVEEIKAEVKNKSKDFSHDFLWKMDLMAIECIFKWIETGKPLSKKDFNNLFEIQYCLNEKIHHILLYYFAYSSFFDPDLWLLIKNVIDLIEKNPNRDSFLEAYKYIYKGDTFRLYKIYIDNSKMINIESYLHVAIEKFKNVFILINKTKTLHDKEMIELLFSYFETSNVQFRKTLNRLYSSNLYNQHDTYYINHHFLIYEPFPRFFSKLIFKRSLSLVKQVNQLRELINWQEAHFY